MIAAGMRPRDVIVVALALTACAFDSVGGSGGFTPNETTSGDNTGAAEATVTSTTQNGDDTLDDADTTQSPAGSEDTGGPPPAVEDIPFGEPTPIAALNNVAADDEAPTLSSDQLEIIFASNRPGGQGGLDLYRSTRAAMGDVWSPPVPIDALNGGFDETSPELTGDGQTMLFISNRGGSYDVYLVARDLAGAWGSPEHVAGLSTSSNEYAATPVGGTDVVLLCSDRPTGFGASDIYEGLVLRDGGFSALLPVNVSTTDDECAMAMRGDQRELIFTSDRAGGPGGTDLWQVSRGAVGDIFSPAALLDAINSSAIEDDPWLSPDGRTLYFASTRAGANTDLFIARRL